MSNQLTPELTAKRDHLLGLLSGYGRVAVAFSAGVDSTVVAKAAQLACGRNAIAVTATSASLPSGEEAESIRLAEFIGIRHQIVRTDEFSNPLYTRNTGDRCYHCKSELYSQIDWRTDQFGVDIVVNGANLDDLGDYRPGMKAAREHGVRSPLIEVGMNKAEVRELARYWTLPVSEKPASPCLSSRIAYGLEVTPERVHRVDMAERFLKELTGLAELRVRYEAHDLARIEVAPEHFSKFIDVLTNQRIRSRFHEIGFRYVTLDLDGFRSGSLNASLPLVALHTGLTH